MQEFNTIYPGTEDFIDSTAAARVNGYLGGYGTCSVLREQLDSLGLSQAVGEKLMGIVCGDESEEPGLFCPSGSILDGFR